ncbi:MAG: TetR/AcrR family transcriptional regulator [Thainema sp.]
MSDISSASSKKRDRSRAAILAAALDLFTERGYDGTSIDDIRKAVGFRSKSSLYAHFASKEAIAEALQTHIFEQMNLILLQSGATAGADPLDRLTASLRAAIRWALTHPKEHTFRFIRNQQERLLSGRFDYMRDPKSDIYVHMFKLMAELRQHYPVRAIADQALVSLVAGVVSRSVIDQEAFGAIPLEETVEQVLTVCLAIVLESENLHSIELSEASSEA